MKFCLGAFIVLGVSAVSIVGCGEAPEPATPPPAREAVPVGVVTGGSAPETTMPPPPPDAVVEVGPACDEAFAGAAAISDMRDTVEDLDLAMRACRTVAEWSAASAKHPTALDGVDPEFFLSNRCDFGGPQTHLCDEIRGR